MLLAGPIELSPGLTLVIMAILGVVGLALCLAGGLLARVISRHPAALPLGSATFAVSSMVAGTVLGLGPGLATGVVATVTLGVALRSRPAATMSADPDDVAREHERPAPPPTPLP